MEIEIEKKKFTSKQLFGPYASEAQLQSLCFQWHWNTFISKRRTLWHINNNPAGGAIRGSQYKAVGVVQGIADLELMLQGKNAYIELKIDNKIQSAEQIDFENKCIAHGHDYKVVRTLDKFISLVLRYYGYT